MKLGSLNTMAVAGFVCTFMCTAAGLVLSMMLSSMAPRRCYDQSMPRPALLMLMVACLMAGCDTARPAPVVSFAADSFAADSVYADTRRPDLNSACAATIKKLAQEMYAYAPVRFTIVVRMDYQTLAVKGFQLIRGINTKTTLAQARATAQQDTGFGTKAKLISPAKPVDLFVFYQSPGDFGGAAAVSVDTGKTVFGGGIVWMGHGKISVPKTWRPVSQLGVGCQVTSKPLLHSSLTRGYDLRTSGALPEAEVKKVLAPLQQTAIQDAIRYGGYFFHAVVLLYPPTVGAFNPKVAEYVALVNGGWAE